MFTFSSRSESKGEEKEANLAKLYCVSKKMKNYQSEGWILTEYRARADIPESELFGSFPRDETVQFFEKFEHAKLAAYHKTKSGEDVAGMGSICPAEAYAVFEVSVRLPDTAKSMVLKQLFDPTPIMPISLYGKRMQPKSYDCNYYVLNQSDIREIVSVTFYDKKYYKDKTANKYLQKLNSKEDLQTNLAHFFEELDNQSRVSPMQKAQAKSLLQKIKEEKTEVGNIFKLCFDECNKLSEDSEYKKMLRVICDILTANYPKQTASLKDDEVILSRIGRPR